MSEELGNNLAEMSSSGSSSVSSEGKLDLTNSDEEMQMAMALSLSLQDVTGNLQGGAIGQRDSNKFGAQLENEFVKTTNILKHKKRGRRSLKDNCGLDDLSCVADSASSVSSIAVECSKKLKFSPFLETSFDDQSVPRFSEARGSSEHACDCESPISDYEDDVEQILNCSSSEEESIGFISKRKKKRIDISAGSRTSIVDSPFRGTLEDTTASPEFNEPDLPLNLRLKPKNPNKMSSLRRKPLSKEEKSAHMDARRFLWNYLSEEISDDKGTNVIQSGQRCRCIKMDRLSSVLKSLNIPVHDIEIRSMLLAFNSGEGLSQATKDLLESPAELRLVKKPSNNSSLIKVLKNRLRKKCKNLWSANADLFPTPPFDMTTTFYPTHLLASAENAIDNSENNIFCDWSTFCNVYDCAGLQFTKGGRIW